MRTVKEQVCLGMVLAIAAITIASPTLAQVDFSKAEDVGNQILGFTGGALATIAFTLAFIVSGFLAAFNKISWVWVGGIVLGAVLVFGAANFVGSLRGVLS